VKWIEVRKQLIRSKLLPRRFLERFTVSEIICISGIASHFEDKVASPLSEAAHSNTVKIP
jgi:hypothetical protein